MDLLNRLFGKKRPTGLAALFSGEDYQTFLEMVRAYFRAQGVEITIEEDSGKVNWSGYGELGLRNLAQNCAATPRRRWEHIIAGHFEVMRQALRDNRDLEERMRDFSKIAGLLAVRLWPAESGDQNESLKLTVREDLPGTLATLVLDLPNSIVTVPPETAAQWGKSTEELFEIALNNVRGRVFPEITRQTIAKDANLVILSGRDFLTATHVLLLKEHPRCVGKYGALVAVPSRTSVLCYPIDDARVETVAAALAPIARQLFEAGPGSVSPWLYWYHGERFTALDRGSPIGRPRLPAELLRLLSR